VDHTKHLKQINKLLLQLSADIMKAGNSTAYDFDFYILSTINRTISLNKAFSTLIKDKNSLTAISIVRLQLDNAIRLHAAKVASNPQDFLDHFFDEKPINQYKDGKQNFSDKFLVTKLDEEVPGALALYEHLCNFIHFSNSHFQAAKTKSTNPSAMFTFVVGESDVLNENEKNEYYDRMIRISNTIAKKGTEWVLQKKLIS
jgi:hypothetical protein